ncbi:hypothetical protein [Paenibacillus sp. MMS20-IR301]|uniref:hypothetical protein n=1 Tax=Paenibacillus sp. MMS20-IR301 TaxID=2895946 RepID=UPI0028F09262|nr:hypothetical protein [Paenibacillus sp. MMS20-IR301]WNS41212.1 hypothetical protein LOS79_19440 [Paenibacillus sp. MMS20-IR301]
MKKIMEVGDVFESKEEGTIIVGINPVLAYINKVGDNIILRTPENTVLELDVISVQISNSPTDKKMVGICLGKSIKPTDIPLGSVVYVV